jgi:tRNA (guanine-N7-)-methyltransferase
METTTQPIRTFVSRERRLTQRTFPEALWARYGINPTNPVAFTNFFNPIVSLTLEIGFGTGDTLFRQAQAHPNQGYIGIEVYKTGIIKLLSKLSKTPLNNIRLLEGDAVRLLSESIPHNSLNTIQILFPDPWPKRRHHKRRLIQPAFVNLLHQALTPNGWLYLATDWEHYAQHMLNILEASSFVNHAGAHQFADRPMMIPLTKFEQRAQGLGHTIRYLAFKKCA